MELLNFEKVVIYISLVRHYGINGAERVLIIKLAR